MELSWMEIEWSSFLFSDWVLRKKKSSVVCQPPTHTNDDLIVITTINWRTWPHYAFTYRIQPSTHPSIHPSICPCTINHRTINPTVQKSQVLWSTTIIIPTTVPYAAIPISHPRATSIQPPTRDVIIGLWLGPETHFVCLIFDKTLLNSALVLLLLLLWVIKSKHTISHATSKGPS